MSQLAWHAPQVQILEWPTLIGPAWAFVITIKAGHAMIFRSIPSVKTTRRKFDAVALMEALADYVERVGGEFYVHELITYADELARHGEQVQLGVSSSARMFLSRLPGPARSLLKVANNGVTLR